MNRIVVAMFAGLLLAGALRAEDAAGQAEPKKEAAAARTATFAVAGMQCPVNCPAVLAEALKKVDGVKDCAVSFEKKEVTVSYEKDKTCAEAIAASLKDTQYKLTVKEPTPAKPVDAQAHAEE